MTQQQITQNNRLIAEFMGRKPQTDGISWFDENYKPLDYSDWNKIMPVVEKIESLGFDFTIKGSNGDRLQYFITIKKYGTYDDGAMYSCSKIEAVFDTIVEFINWYNENK